MDHSDENQPTPREPRYDAFISYSHALDGRLAPAVQRGLSRFAKSWRKMRALRVFRDETSLSVTPALWPSIEQALDESEFFILFASPDAAASRWVGRELDYWCEHKSPERVLLVLTDGSLRWDEGAKDFDWTVTNALPGTARGRFAAEPRYVDLRWARTEQDLSLQHPRFRGAIADLAATIHGKPKDELIGEDVRQYRRTVRVMRSVIAAITMFAVLLSVLAVATWQARNRAEREGQTAGSRFLSAAAINSLDRHLDRAALLSVEALDIRDTAEARNALLTTVQRTPDAQRYLRSEGAEVADVAINPQGTIAAAVDHDGLVSAWDVRSGHLLVPPTVAHDGPGLAVAFSPDGRLLATGGGDGRVMVWDAAMVAPVQWLGVTDPAVRSLAFSPDGKWLAAGGGAATSTESLMGFADRTPRRIELFEVSTWDHTAALTGHLGAVEGLQFSADSRRIYSSIIDFDSGIIWWDTRTWYGEQVSFPEQDGRNVGMGISPDGNQIAVASDLSEVALVWDVQNDRSIASLGGLTSRLSGLAYSPEGDFIAASTFGGEVGIWATDDLTRPVQHLAAHDRNIEGGGTVVAFGPRGLLVSGSSGGAVVLHDVNATTRLVTDVLSGKGDLPSGSVVGNERGAFAISSSESRTAQLWDAHTGARRSIQLPSDASLGTGSALSPDGTRMTVDITKDDQHTLALIDTEVGQVLWRVTQNPIGAAFSPDGSIIAIADDKGIVRLHDVETGTRRATFPAQPPVPEELKRYDELDIVFQQDRAVLAFDDQGSILAVAGPDGPVWLWDVKEEKLASAKPLLGHGRVSSMAFSPGAAVLATGGNDELIRLWNVENGELIGLTSERPQGRVYALLFSPDGRTLVSSSPEHEFWDVGTRQRIGEPIDVSDPWSEMAFSTDGSKLAVVGPDGDARRVNTSVKSWVAIACSIANRDLSPDEARQFLDGQDPRPCTP
jgi:WD40 repeat protein